MLTTDFISHPAENSFRYTPSPAPMTTGFGAAKHLSEQGYNVTLLEAAPTPGGLATGFRTASGREVEAGMKGFWYQVWIGCLDEL